MKPLRNNDICQTSLLIPPENKIQFLYYISVIHISSHIYTYAQFHFKYLFLYDLVFSYIHGFACILSLIFEYLFYYSISHSLQIFSYLCIKSVAISYFHVYFPVNSHEYLIAYSYHWYSHFTLLLINIFIKKWLSINFTIIHHWIDIMKWSLKNIVLIYEVFLWNHTSKCLCWQKIRFEIGSF